MNNRKWVLVTAIVLMLVFVAIPAWAQYQTKVYFDNDGDRLNIGTGGEFLIASGATVTIHDATYLQANAGMVITGNLSALGPVLLRNGEGLDNIDDGTVVITANTTSLTGGLTTAGAITIAGPSQLSGNVTAVKNLTVQGAYTLTGPSQLGGEVTVVKNLTVQGAITVAGPPQWNSDAVAIKSLTVQGAYTLTGPSQLGGDVTAVKNLAVQGAITVTGPSQLTGAVTAAGGLTLGTTSFSGTVHFGIVTACTSGTVVYHGYAAAPTVAFVQGYAPEIFNGITKTLYIGELGATTMTVHSNGGNAVNCYWLAGK